MEICESFTPNFYNDGRYYTKNIETEPNNRKVSTNKKIITKVYPEENTTKNSSGAKNGKSQILKIEKSNKNTFKNPTSEPKTKVIVYKSNNHNTTVSSHRLENFTSPPSIKKNEPRFETGGFLPQNLSGNNFYKPGSISDILSQFQSLPIINNHNGNGNFQIEDQLSTSNPSKIEALTTSSRIYQPKRSLSDAHNNSQKIYSNDYQNNFEPIRTAILNQKIYHRQSPKNPLRITHQNYSNLQGNDFKPVHTALLNHEVYHRSNDNNTIITTDHPLIGSPSSSPIVQYNQSILHKNEAKYLPTPSLPKRKQRNLSQISVDKLIEHEDNNNKNVHTKKGSNGENDPKDDANNGYRGDAVTVIGTTKTASSSSSTSTETETEAPSSEESTQEKHEIRYLHDIFLNYPKSHQAKFGHVQLTPHLFEKRFESRNEGNRYKGEILWMDNKGGYSQHSWNMALGKL
ncbi:uncharacterized protein LOC142235970 [Haematobia irritans]|uniref:uncharacterized protein LOC142235970 n=1 Tax=Haematobia irritans TaxID=7368 RepID=UPI003F4FB2BF